MGGNDWSFTRLAFTALVMLLLHPKETCASSSSFVGSTVCQSDHFAYKKLYQRGSSFTVNGNPVDRIHFCEAIRIHKAKGCVLGVSFRDLCYLLGMRRIVLLSSYCHHPCFINWTASPFSMQGEGFWKKNILKQMRLNQKAMWKSAWQLAGFFSSVVRYVVLASIRRGKQIVTKYYPRNLIQVIQNIERYFKCVTLLVVWDQYLFYFFNIC